MKQIVRCRSNGEPEIPVSVVSHDYTLIQHKDLLDIFAQAIQDERFDNNTLIGSMLLSEYGERMQVSVNIPGLRIDPGDGYPVVFTIDCFNSVDKSCPLEITITGQRIICTNGMIHSEASRFRKIHCGNQLNKQKISSFVHQQLGNARSLQYLYKKWYEHPVTLEQVYQWADDELAKAWGKHAASRVCHIARTGMDGVVYNTFETMIPHKVAIKETEEVPGACAPIRNAFHLGQALSWIASHRSTIDDRLVKMREIPFLIESFVK